MGRGKLAGYSSLTQASIGLALGGQSYTELIFFENKAALDRFKSGGFAFAAQASAVALKSGVSANAKYTDGVAVFTMGLDRPDVRGLRRRAEVQLSSRFQRREDGPRKPDPRNGSTTT